MNKILIATITKAVKKLLQKQGGSVTLSVSDIENWVNENCPGFEMISVTNYDVDCSVTLKVKEYDEDLA